MDVVLHPAECQYDPSTALDFLTKSFGKAFVVPEIMKQSSSSIAPGDEVIVCTGELDSRRPRHGSDHR
jgi:hypothetical protein